MEGALIMALVGYLSVTAMLMLIDCKYAILSSGGRRGGHAITMDKQVRIRRGLSQQVFNSITFIEIKANEKSLF